MKRDDYECRFCGGEINYNEENKTGVCSSCGRKYRYDYENIAENPEEAGFKWQQGVNRANDLYKASHSVNPNRNNPQSTIIKSAAPRKKSVVGRIFLVIGIVYTIMCAISFLLNVIPEIINNNRDNGPTPTTSAVNIGDGNEEYGTDPTGSGSPRPIETTEFVPNKVLLVNLTPYTDMPYIETNYVSDIFGNDYRNGIFSRIEETDGECSCTYRIYQKYDKLTFTSGIVEFGRGDPGEAIIRIYGDGVLIYERYLNCTSDSTFEEINVSGVNDLRLELYGYSEPEVSLRGSTALYPCIWEPTLYSAH